MSIAPVELPAGVFEIDIRTAADRYVWLPYFRKRARARPFTELIPYRGAAGYVGRLHVLDIGTPRKLIEQVAAEGRGQDRAVFNSRNT